MIKKEKEKLKNCFRLKKIKETGPLNEMHDPRLDDESEF